MRISDWSSDVCSSDLGDDVKSSWPLRAGLHTCYNGGDSEQLTRESMLISKNRLSSDCSLKLESMKAESLVIADQHAAVNRSEEHTYELQSLMRNSYAVFCLKKKKKKKTERDKVTT